MIIFKPSDFLLKTKITLYNNIVRSGKCKGRLLVDLEIYPTPRIIWDFETLGRTACEPDDINGMLKAPFIGNEFRIDQPFIGSRGWGSLINQPRVHMNGITRQVLFGSSNFVGQSFSFCIPNARFQEENLIGQGIISEKFKAELGNESWEFEGGSAGRFITASIDDYWQIHLETRQEALNWLKRKHRNTGTYITTIGRLSQQKKNGKGDNKGHQNLILDEAIERLWTFSFLLSFANGGYIGPLYVEGYHKDRKRSFAGKFIVSRVTPLEQLGPSWLTINSDLTSFLKCFPTFERMEHLPHWQEEFDLILSWYFQSIQPQNLQMNKPWPVVANAVGTALERLGILILVHDIGIRGLRNPADRLKRLLEQMGISQANGYHDVKHVQDFIDIRNDATHPRPQSTLSDQMRNRVLNGAIQWLEEALLWRLGYNGEYRDRLKSHYASIKHRYDLSTRDPSW